MPIHTDPDRAIGVGHAIGHGPMDHSIGIIGAGQAMDHSVAGAFQRAAGQAAPRPSVIPGYRPEITITRVANGYVIQPAAIMYPGQAPTGGHDLVVARNEAEVCEIVGEWVRASLGLPLPRLPVPPAPQERADPTA